MLIVQKLFYTSLIKATDTFRQPLPSLALTASMLFSLGCHGQSAETLSPELARAAALTIRARANVPYYVDVTVGDRKPSTMPGYDDVTATFSAPGAPDQKLTFLLSKDGKTLAQFNTFALNTDMRNFVKDDGRPGRGGPESAPVHIVVFDDLQCPYCARMHKQLFPAILERYGDKVHIVYKDNPLSIHAWAAHAAIDVDCLASQSDKGYWNVVDDIHDNLASIGKDTQAQTSQSKPDTEAAALARSLADLDRITLDEGKKQNVNTTALQACINKQDPSTIHVSMQEADHLNIDGAPMLFINGQRIEGAVPVAYVWKAIDDALRAQGITPPPAVPLPSPANGQ